MDGLAVGVAEDVAVLLGLLAVQFIDSQLPDPLEVDLHVRVPCHHLSDTRLAVHVEDDVDLALLGGGFSVDVSPSETSGFADPQTRIGEDQDVARQHDPVSEGGPGDAPALLDPFPQEPRQLRPVLTVEVRSPLSVVLRLLEDDLPVDVAPLVAPVQEGRELTRLVEDGGLTGRLALLGVRPAPVEEPGDLLGAEVGDLIPSEVGDGIGPEKGDDGEVPLGLLALGFGSLLEVIDHLLEVQDRDGLTELGLDPDLVKEVVGELPCLIEVGGTRTPIDSARSVGDLDPTEPQLLGSVLELVEDDLTVVEGLLIDDLRDRHGGMVPQISRT